jgi:Stage II sporulation protein E (SpoIIE)
MLGLTVAPFVDVRNGCVTGGSAVENACATLGLDATGTLVHDHLGPAGRGAWHLSWTNAGHPPPLLLERPGGRPERLATQDRLLWPDLAGRPRTRQRRLLPPGATLSLYTDGLVERRGGAIDAAIDRIAAALAAAPATVPFPPCSSSWPPRSPTPAPPPKSSRSLHESSLHNATQETSPCAGLAGRLVEVP